MIATPPIPIVVASVIVVVPALVSKRSRHVYATLAKVRVTTVGSEVVGRFEYDLLDFTRSRFAADRHQERREASDVRSGLAGADRTIAEVSRETW